MLFRAEEERERESWSVASYYSRSCYDNIFSRNKGHLCDALAPRLVRSTRMPLQTASTSNDNIFLPDISQREYLDTLVLFRSYSSWMQRVITISRFPCLIFHPNEMEYRYLFRRDISIPVDDSIEVMTRYNYSQSHWHMNI